MGALCKQSYCFCVGYKKEDIENISTKLQKVTYSSQPYDIEAMSDESILFIKSNEWEYENEWRGIYKLVDGDITHLDPNVGNSDYKNKLHIPHIDHETNKPEILESEIRIRKIVHHKLSIWGYVLLRR